MANSKIYLGSTNIGSLFQGADDISIYLGQNKVYPLEEPFKWKAILSNGTTQSGACTSSTVLNGDLLPTNTVNLEVGNCVTELSNFEGKLNSLSSCTISDSVTKIIGSTFRQKTLLKIVVVGSGVTSIERWAFNSCNRLESLTFKSIVPPTLGDAVFVNTNNCPIYVPSESVNAYKNADGWRSYADRIQAIP